MPRKKREAVDKGAPETDAEAETRIKVATPSAPDRRPLEILGSLIREASEDLLKSHLGTLELGCNIGDYLIEAKAQAERGQWLAFLADETPYSSRHAERLMYLARNRGKLRELRPADTSLRGAVAMLQHMNKQPKVDGPPTGQGNGKPEVELPDEFYAFDQIEDAADLPLPDGLIDLNVFSPPYGLGIDYDLTSDDHGYETYLGFVREWVKEIRRVIRHPSQDDPSGGRVAVNIPLDTRWAPNIPKLSGDPHAFYYDWLEALLGDPEEDSQPADWRLNYRFSIIWAKVADKSGIHDDRAQLANTLPGGIGDPVAVTECPECGAPAGSPCRFEVEQIDGQPSSHRARGSVDSPTSPYVVTGVEMLVVLHAGQWKIKDLRTSDLDHDEWIRDTDGVWKVPSAPAVLRAEHPAPFHPDIPRRLIKLLSFPGQIVLDQFAGRGTTIEVAVETGRRCYAFERSPKYVNTGRFNTAEALKAKYGSDDKLVSVTDLHPNLRKRNGNGRRPKVIDVPLPTAEPRMARVHKVESESGETTTTVEPEQVAAETTIYETTGVEPETHTGVLSITSMEEEWGAEQPARVDPDRLERLGQAIRSEAEVQNPFEHELEGDTEEAADDASNPFDQVEDIDEAQRQRDEALTGIAEQPNGVSDDGSPVLESEPAYEPSDVRDRELDGGTSVDGEIVSVEALLRDGGTVVGGLIYRDGMPTHVIGDDGTAQPIPNVSVDLGAINAARQKPDPAELPPGATSAGEWHDNPNDATVRERDLEYGEGMRSTETRRGAPPTITEDERESAVALAEPPVRSSSARSVYSEDNGSESAEEATAARPTDRHAKCPHGRRRNRCAECRASATEVSS